MRPARCAVDQDDLVARAEETAHAGPVFHPDAEIEQSAEDRLGRRLQEILAPPVYEELDERARGQVHSSRRAPLPEELQLTSCILLT